MRRTGSTRPTTSAVSPQQRKLRGRKASRVVAALIAIAAAVLVGTATPAAATTALPRYLPSTPCNQGWVCTFWDQHYGAGYQPCAVAAGGTAGNIADYWNYTYTDACYSYGHGIGERVANNNGSNENLGYGLWYARLHYDPYYGGAILYLSANGRNGWQQAGSGLGVLLNNLRSSDWQQY